MFFRNHSLRDLFVFALCTCLFLLGGTVFTSGAVCAEDWEEKLHVYEDEFENEKPGANFYFGMDNESDTQEQDFIDPSDDQVWWVDDEDNYIHITEHTSSYTWNTEIELITPDEGEHGDIGPEISWGQSGNEDMGNIPAGYEVTMELDRGYGSGTLAEDLDLTQEGEIVWDDPVFESFTDEDVAYLEATIVAEPAGVERVVDFRVGPNPFRAEEHDKVSFQFQKYDEGAGVDFEIEIYTITGRLVYEESFYGIADEVMEDGKPYSQLHWEDADDVASGHYIYRLKDNNSGDEETGQLVIIR